MTAAEQWNFWRKCKLMQWSNPFAAENFEDTEAEKMYSKTGVIVGEGL